jgi:hypothetical protein
MYSLLGLHNVGEYLIEKHDLYIYALAPQSL